MIIMCGKFAKHQITGALLKKKVSNSCLFGADVQGHMQDRFAVLCTETKHKNIH